MNRLLFRAILAARQSGSNWWPASAVAAYRFKGAVSQAAGYVNLVNPGTYDASPTGSPTWDAADGLAFNGVDQFLATGIVPTGSFSLLVRFSNGASASNETPIGVYGTSPNRFAIYTRTASKTYFANYGIATSGNLYNSGVLCLAGKDGYYNGVYEATVGAGVVSTALDIYIGAVNNSGVAGFFFPGKIQAAAICNTTLSAGDVSAASDNMLAL